MTKRTPIGTWNDSMMDNPVYDQVSPAHSTQVQQQQKSSVSDSRVSSTVSQATASPVNVASNPVYGENIDTFHPMSRPQRSTIRHVQNPVYGDPSDRGKNEEVYSTPDDLSNENRSGQPEYSYAIVNAPSSKTKANMATKQENDSSSSMVEDPEKFEYTTVDKSKGTRNVATLLGNYSDQLYEKLKHEQSPARQGQARKITRLAENKELDYGTLT